MAVNSTNDVRYSTDHEWVRADGGTATVGISDHAQEQLGDIVFVELPDVGQHFEKGAAAAVVESVKAASEVYMAVSGEVLETNDKIAGDPSLVNSSPEADGWLFRITLTDPSQLGELMDQQAYESYLKTLD